MAIACYGLLQTMRLLCQRARVFWSYSTLHLVLCYKSPRKLDRDDCFVVKAHVVTGFISSSLFQHCCSVTLGMLRRIALQCIAIKLIISLHA